MVDRDLFPGELERIEDRSVLSPVSLVEMCDILTRGFELPPFEFGGEDDYDYAFSLTDGIEYNISRACDDGALRIKGVAARDGSNFLISISFHEGRPMAPTADEIMAKLSAVLADVPGTAVLQSRSWLWGEI